MSRPEEYPTADMEIDGLVCAALRAEPGEEEIRASASLEVDPADRRALSALGPDLVDDALATAGPVRARPGPRPFAIRVAAAILCAIGLGVALVTILPGAPALAGCSLDAEPGASYATVAPRRVRLEGGTLNVLVDPGEESFVVETGAGEIVVGGGAFSVTASTPAGPGAATKPFTSVLVTEGRVACANDFGRADAGAGELLLADSDGPPVVRVVGAPRGPWDGGIAIAALAVTTAGDLIVTADDVGTLRVWDARDGKLLRVVARVHTERITDLAASPDGRTLASASQDGTVRLWDVKRGVPLRTLEGHRYSVNAVVFPAGGSHLLSGSTDGTVRVWEVVSGKVLRSMGTAGRKGDEGYRRTIVDVAVSPTGATALSVDLGGRLSVWDLAKGTRVRAVETGKASLYAVAALSEEAALIGSEDGTLARIDLLTGRRIWSAASGDGPVVTIAPSPDGTRALLTRVGPTVELFGLEDGRRAGACKPSLGRTAAAAWFPDGSRFVAGGADGVLKLRDTTTDAWINGAVEQRGGHALPVSALAFDASGRRVASGGGDGSIRIWKMPGMEEERAIDAHRGAVRALVFLPARDVLLSAGDDGTLRLTDLSTGKVQALPGAGDAPIVALAVSTDGGLAATGDGKGAVRLWDLAAGEELRKLEGHEVRVAAVRFTPDGEHLVSGDHNGRLRWWKVETGEKVRELYVTEVSLIVFSRDARTALAPSLAFDHPDPGLHIWDLEAGKCRTLEREGGRRFVSGPAVFVANGSRVIEADGGALNVWDAAGGKHLRKIAEGSVAAPRGRVTALAVSPDGHVAIVAAEDRSLRVFEIPAD